jgi:hypothetical protein
MESFKRIYEWFTIDKDHVDMVTNDFPLHASVIPLLASALPYSGAEITYVLQEVDAAKLTTCAFDTNTEERPPSDAPSLCIVGGGPNGLFAAVVFQMAFPAWFVYVLEKRHDEKHRRRLLRTQVVWIHKCAPYLEAIGLNGLARQKTVPINVLEIHLAHRAQQYGVRIFHTDAVASMDALRLPPGTQAVLDARGGLCTGTCVGLYRCVTGFDIVSSRMPLPYDCTYLGDGEYLMRSPQGDAYYVKDSTSLPARRQCRIVAQTSGTGRAVLFDRMRQLAS